MDKRMVVYRGKFHAGTGVFPAMLLLAPQNFFKKLALLFQKPSDQL